MSEASENILRIISDLEYANFNLCKNPHRDVSLVVVSTCPEATLQTSIRDLKAVAKELT